MADIRVRPAKRGAPWWLWLLILLLVVAVGALFFLMEDEDDSSEAGDLGVGAAEVEPARDLGTEAPLTVLDSIPAADDARSEAYVGREVSLADAEVARVFGDSAFAIRGAAGRDIPVVIDEASGGTISGLMTEGERIRLQGTLQRAGESPEGLPQAARSEVSAGTFYIAARSADVTGSALSSDSARAAPSSGARPSRSPTDTTTNR